MRDIQWWDTMKWVGAAVIGAVISLLVKAWYDRWQNRQQPIRFGIEIDPIFSKAPGLRATVNVVEGDKTVEYEMLTLVKIVVTNSGNTDLDHFGFELTIPNGHDVVNAECEPPDRSHQITMKTMPTPSAPLSALDFECFPFNRKDTYIAKMYVTAEKRALVAKDIKPTTASPVRFVSAAQPEATPPLLDRSLAVLGSACLIVFIGYWLGWFEPHVTRGELATEALVSRISQMSNIVDTSRALIDIQKKQGELLAEIKREHPEWFEAAKAHEKASNQRP
jgi:hypothetical protein